MTVGFLVVNKPAGITSHDVVAVVRAVTGIKKVGHTGTLDPFATGVLPLALGPATRLIQYLDEAMKVYEVEIALGSATDTGDPTGEVIATCPLPDCDEAHVRDVLATFLGKRMQEPPQYSAVKVDGKPLYHYARKGQVKRAAPREITVHEIEFVSFTPDTLKVVIHCSRGTYARVLAREIGQALGSEGYLRTLNRSRSGPFISADSVDLPTVAEMVSQVPYDDWKDVLLSRGRKEERVPWKPKQEVRGALKPHVRSPLKSLNHLPIVDVQTQDARRVRNGGTPPVAPSVVGGGRYVVACGPDLVAVAEATSSGVKTLRVVPATS